MWLSYFIVHKQTGRELNMTDPGDNISGMLSHPQVPSSNPEQPLKDSMSKVALSSFINRLQTYCPDKLG